MRTVPLLLLITATLGAAVGGAAFLHPDGLEGLKHDLLGGSLPSIGESTGEPVAEGTSGKDDGPMDLAESALKDLRKGELDYDAGRFNSAVTTFLMARATAQDDATRRRATDGLHKALLANALVAGVPRSSLDDAEARRQLGDLEKSAEERPDEAAWLAACRFAAGASLLDRTPYLAERTLEAATAGGPVEQQLRENLYGSRARHLSEAMRGRGLNGDLPPRPVASTGTGEPGVDPTDPDPFAPEPGEEPSGIGKVGRGKHISVPFGDFSSAMRTKLKKAIDLEKKGAAEYELAAPNKADRRMHRQKALEHLSAARAIYQEALEKDPKARGVEVRLREVFQMIAFLRKDAHVDE